MEGLSLSGRRRGGVELTSLSSFRSLQALSRIAYDIVRLALFHEQKKIGLSRTDINKKGTYVRMDVWLPVERELKASSRGILRPSLPS